jgi:hypothetical protein
MKWRSSSRGGRNGAVDQGAFCGIGKIHDDDAISAMLVWQAWLVCLRNTKITQIRGVGKPCVMVAGY